jgi:hypothetical protein
LGSVEDPDEAALADEDEEGTQPHSDSFFPRPVARFAPLDARL